MDDYPLIEFIYDKRYDELTSKEAEANFDWFINIIPKRLDILQNTMHEAHPHWCVDYTRESLYDLGKWVNNVVKMRKLGKQDKEFLIVEGMSEFQIKMIREMDEKLSSGSERICFDAGIYIGETLRKNVENLEWRLEKRKSMTSYHSPVLTMESKTGIRRYPMIVLDIVRTAVIGMAEKSIRDDRFVGIYDHWYEKLTKGPRPLPPDLMP